MATTFQSGNGSTRRTAQRERLNVNLFALPPWTHPEVLYWWGDWKMIRDCASGEKEIKAERQLYLPMFESMDAQEYESYLDRATFYNFTGRTIRAMTGTIFSRAYVIENMPARLEDRLTNVSQDNADFETFSKFVAKELLTLGRVGVLVDLPGVPSTTPTPYVVSYTAENILDWDTATDPATGKMFLRRVVLRELKTGKTANGTRAYFARYRVLEMSGGVYMQAVYEAENADATLELEPVVSIPMSRGEPLDYIPFHIFSPTTTDMRVETPPLLDIAALNISHYRSYAHLEQGRFFTGFPVYYAEVGQGDQGGADYELAPNRVWEVQAGSKPGLLEFNGQGLKFLENALDQKEQQASSLGGRMIGVRTTAVAESDNQVKMKDRNEQSILLDISKSLDLGFTRLLQMWVRLSGGNANEVQNVVIEFSKDFLFDGIGAREFRAIQSMYMDGIIPIDVVYAYLHKAGVIPDWMKQDEFERLLKKSSAFPNQPDAQARAEGYSSAQAKQSEEQNELDRENEIELLEIELEADAEEAEKGRKAQEKSAKLAQKSAEKIAKSQPKPVPGAPPGGKPAAKKAPPPKA